MSQLIRLDQRSQTIVKLFEDNKKRMIAAAPRSTGDPMRIFQIAFNSIAYNTDLLECTQQSLVGGVFESLKLGIALGGPMQEGWLIPFKNQGQKTATLIVGYMGYRNIIDRAGAVVDMHPRAVHIREVEEKAFDYWFGDEPRIMHRPRYTVRTENDLHAVYCVARLRRGGKQMEVLLKDEVDDHRKKSRAKDSGPWVNEYVAMALKTSVRKISKYLPKSNELLARALDLDERADLGKDQDFEIPAGTTLIDEEMKQAGPPRSPMDALKDRMGVKPDIVVTSESPDEARLREENEALDRKLAAEEAEGEKNR